MDSVGVVGIQVGVVGIQAALLGFRQDCIPGIYFKTDLGFLRLVVARYRQFC